MLLTFVGSEFFSFFWIVEMKTSWHSGKMICVAVFFIAAVVILVTIAIVQTKPIEQKYKVGND